MEISQLFETLASMPPEEVRPWLKGLFAVLCVMGLGFYLEYSFFRKTHRGGSWLVVRLVSLLAVPITLAAVVLPARATSGMEGLAVFYAGLLTVAPLLWFGSHRLAGRWARPPLSGLESFLLAMSGLAIYAVPGTAYFAARIPLQNAARDLASQAPEPSRQLALSYTVLAPQRYEMPGAGVIYTQSLLANPGVRLERVDQRQAGPWSDTKGLAHPVFCTQGNDLHLMWSAREDSPTLRLHWAEQNGQPAIAEFKPDLSGTNTGTSKVFTIAFRADGFDPIAPIPRSRAHLVFPRPNGAPYFDMLDVPQTGEALDNDCLMPGYRRVRWEKEYPVQAVGIMFYLKTGTSPLRGLIERTDGMAGKTH